MVKRVVLLNGQSEELTAEELTLKLNLKGVTATCFFEHAKASERYVIISVSDGTESKEWYLPYYYRRTNVRIDTVAELVDYVRHCVDLFSKKHIEAFKTRTGKLAKTLFGKNANVTLPIFKKLLANCGEWVWNKQFANPNPQRRIQAIKEAGFTVATKIDGHKTYHTLLPFGVVKAPTYETISPRRVGRSSRLLVESTLIRGSPLLCRCYQIINSPKFAGLRGLRNQTRTCPMRT